MIVQIEMDFFGRGGMQVRARQEVRALLNAGHRVTVITDSADGQSVSMGESFKSQFSVVVKRPIIVPGLFSVSKDLSFTTLCYKALKRLARKESIDLVVSHDSVPCYAAVCFAKRNKVPTAFVIHLLVRDRLSASVNPYSWFTTQMYRHSNRYAASNVNYCVAVSRYIQEATIAEGAKPGNAFVLHNAVDTQTFHPGDSDIKDIDVLFVGRLAPEKGVTYLLEAARDLSPETQISIVGDGPLRKQLEHQAEGLRCGIIFHGWIKHEQLPEYIRRAKLKIVPSVWAEPQGIVVPEAMACGVPVIGTNTGGIPEMIEHGKNGWLVPPRDAKTLANTITAVLADESKREAAARAAYETAQSYSVSQFDNKLVALYEKMINNCSS